MKQGARTFTGALTPDGEFYTSTQIVDRGARRLILGVKLEVSLFSNWSVEFNALHREWKRNERGDFLPGFLRPDGSRLTRYGPFTQVLSSWQFPILAKYRFGVGGLHAFVEGGPSFRTAGSGTGLSHVGITAGSGLEFMTGGFRIAPTFRYTRWKTKNWSDFGGAKLNQVEVLVALDRPSTAFEASAFGKRTSIGAIVGIVPGRDFKPGVVCCQTPERNSPIWGLMLEANLTRNIFVEVDGLYRSLHGFGSEFGRSERFAHLTWEFPVLAKYKFREGQLWRPFIAGGPSFRAEGNLNLRSVSHYGGTVAGGVETRLNWLKIAPQVRYTHWGDGDEGVRGRTWRSQAQLLVSLSF